jgi:hypothetical protein
MKGFFFLFTLLTSMHLHAAVPLYEVQSIDRDLLLLDNDSAFQVSNMDILTLSVWETGDVVKLKSTTVPSFWKPIVQVGSNTYRASVVNILNETKGSGVTGYLFEAPNSLSPNTFAIVNLTSSGLSLSDGSTWDFSGLPCTGWQLFDLVMLGEVPGSPLPNGAMLLNTRLYTYMYGHES